MKGKTFITITSTGRNEWSESIGFSSSDDMYFTTINSKGQRDVRLIETLSKTFQVFCAGIANKICELADDKSLGSDVWICSGALISEVICCRISYYENCKHFISIINETDNEYKSSLSAMHSVLNELNEVIKEYERVSQKGELL